MNDMESKEGLQKLLQMLVGIPSATGNESAIAIEIEKFLLANSFVVQRQKVASNRWNLFAQKGYGQSAVLFLGHIDTVRNDGKWRTNPYRVTEENNRLYGVGVSDMKGGIAAFLSASVHSAAYVKILLTVDEENISEGAWKAVRKKNFFKDVALIVSAEPNFNLKENDITIGRTGRCVYDVMFKGKSEHLAQYWKGRDAIERLSEFVTKLYKKRSALFKSPLTIVQVRKIEGESIGMSVCGLARLEVEALLGPKDSIGSIGLILKKLGASTVAVKRRKTPYLEGYYFDSFPYKELIRKIIKKNIGKSMNLKARSSVADDNVLATLGIPVITWGANGGNEHKTNEFLNKTSLLKLSSMYSEFLNCL